MPYTNPWEVPETLPLGASDSDTIDDIIRRLRLDIRERMNTILDPAGQWQNDPIVPLGGGGGGGGGTTIPTAPFGYWTDHLGTVVGPDGTIVGYLDGYIQLQGVARIPLVIDANSTIDSVLMVIDKNAAASVAWALIQVNFGAFPNAVFTLNSGTVSAAGPQNVLCFSGAENVSGQNAYYIKLTGSGGSSYLFYSARTVTHRSLP